MLVRRTAGFIAVILLAGSAALAAAASPGDASAPYPDAQGATQAAAGGPAASASGVSVSGPPSFPILPALPADYFATTPHLLGEWPGIRQQLSDLGIQVSLTGVDEAVLNLSGG
jgi:hypothetical protein